MNIYISEIDPLRLMIAIAGIIAAILVGYLAYRRAQKRGKAHPSFDGLLFANGIVAVGIVGFVIYGAILAYHPGAREIVQRHYEAIGGIAKLKQAMPLFCEGSIQDTSGLNLGRFRFWYDSRGRYRKEVEVGGREIWLGSDGHNAWQVADTMGEPISEEWPAGFWYADLILQDYIHPDTGLTDNQVLFQSKTHYTDSITYQLRFPERYGQAYQIGVYDASTYLLAGRQWLPWREDYWAFYASTFNDYREVNGVVFPFHVKVQVSPNFSMSRTRIFELSISRIETHCSVDSSLWLQSESVR